LFHSAAEVAAGEAWLEAAAKAVKAKTTMRVFMMGSSL
jgi:hypothetical protein